MCHLPAIMTVIFEEDQIAAAWLRKSSSKVLSQDTAGGNGLQAGMVEPAIANGSTGDPFLVNGNGLEPRISRGYLQFLVDSKIVYEALEDSCTRDPRLAAFRDTGLERSEALGKDIAWMIQSYPDAAESTSVSGEAGIRDGRIANGMLPSPTESAVEYAALLKRMVGSSLPAFMCHFYNYYFAHTAGGRMIGRKVAESCLDGRTLEFYKWRSDVKELLEGVRLKIDAMANGWSDDEKEACVAETARSFHYGGRLLKAITS